MDKLVVSVGLSSVILGGLALSLPYCLYTVDAGERAILFDRFVGVKTKVYGEGLHPLIPILQKPHIMSIRTNYRLIRSETVQSKDLQKIQVGLRCLFRPNPEKLRDIFVGYGLDYDERILPSICNEVLKSIIAQFNAEELVTQRDLVSTTIRNNLVERAELFGLIVEDVALVHLGFSKEFTHAIESKQVEQQRAEKQRYLVDKSRQEKMAEVILAEGETEAARLITEAMKSGHEFLELRRIEAAKEIAETLARSKNITYLPSGANVFLSLQRPGGHN